MGAQFFHSAFHSSLDNVLDFLERKKIGLWATAADGMPLSRSNAPDRLAIAVGNEGAGLSPQIRVKAERTVSLPISGSVESLNVAVATGIILYELRS
jgi:TrmH family RNA methyltransferase